METSTVSLNDRNSQLTKSLQSPNHSMISTKTANTNNVDSNSRSPTLKSPLETGQMRSSSPFTANSFPIIHKTSLMSSSPPAATTAVSPLSNDSHLLSTKNSSILLDDQQAMITSSASLHQDITNDIEDDDGDGTESLTSSLSDVETFNGKIVYNPDGSAYIIEGPDSDGSEVEAEISQEGSIIDARGQSPNYGSISFPQIVSAFHISRSYSNEIYPSPFLESPKQTSTISTESKISDLPVMHSYRVFSLRNKKCSSSKYKSSSSQIDENDEIIDENIDKCNKENFTFDDDDDTIEQESRLQALNNCSTVPVKPILMCFICKLSFGYTKSFVAHSIGEHHLSLNDEERKVLQSKNTSAIIQGVGKEKEPLLSFLRPKSSTPAPFRSLISHHPTQSQQLQPQQKPQQQSLDAQQLLAVQMAAVASALRSSSDSLPVLNSKNTNECSSSSSINELANNSAFSSPTNSPDRSSMTNNAEDGEIVGDCVDEKKVEKLSISQTTNNLDEDEEMMMANKTNPSEDGDDDEDENDDDGTVDNKINRFDERSSNSVGDCDVANAVASQFASELADLANLEKFAQAAAVAAAAQQQQMDLHSIAAVMAAAVAASANKSSHLNQISSPATKVSPTSSSSSSSSSVSSSSSKANQSTNFNNNGLLVCPDSKNISLLFNHHSNSPSTDSDASNLLASVGNHSTTARQTSTNSNHPPLLIQHSRNSCKTLKCPKCNWHYKYQETLEIHMKEKHPENEMNCIYCLTNQPHPRLARGETYTCGYKPYRCDVCNYSTTTKGNLSIHMQSDKHINNVQELQNGNIPSTAEHLLQSQALTAAVAQAANGNNTSPITNNNSSALTTNSSATGSGSPVPTSSAANLAKIVAQQQQESQKNSSKISSNHHFHSNSSLTPPTTPNSNANSSNSINSSSSKQKATWRCDVCNYETNVARNLRIHMTSEKHTHNIMILKQNVSQMQQLNALQQGILNPEQLLQLNPGLFAAAAAAAAAGMTNNAAGSNGTNPIIGALGSVNGPNADGNGMQPEVALADMAYNHALLMMASQQQQRNMVALMQQQQQPNTDSKLSSPSSSSSTSSTIPTTLSNASVNDSQATFDMEHPDSSISVIANSIPLNDPNQLFDCCVCGSFSTDSIETLNHHLQLNRTGIREDEVLLTIGGSYICKICSYKTNLKANFQLHCKTDKHLQRLQHHNHIKEGGGSIQSEWKSKLLSNMANPIQLLRCNVCNYFTNSIHKLQLHCANPKHDCFARIFTNLNQLIDDFSFQNNENNSNNGLLGVSSKQFYFHCTLCSSAIENRLQLLKHLSSVKHIRNENIRSTKVRIAQSSSASPTAATSSPSPTSSFLMISGSNSDFDRFKEMFQIKENQPGEKIIFETNDDEMNKIAPALLNQFGLNSTDSLLLKNALIEQQAKLNQFQNLENDQSQQSQQSESISTTNTINCPFCSYQNDSEIRIQMHILVSHPHQHQQSAIKSLSALADDSSANQSKLTPPPSLIPSILCPLCQEPFHERNNLENHLVEIHSVTKEGVQRLMLLVDTTELDKFHSSSSPAIQNNQNKMSTNEKKKLRKNSNDRSDTAEDDQDERKSNDDEETSPCADSTSKQIDDEPMMIDTNNLNEFGNLPAAVLDLLHCPGCQRMFLNLEELFAHMIIEMHLKPTAQGQFQCWRNDCQQQFSSLQSVQIHFRDQHFLKCAKLLNTVGANFGNNILNTNPPNAAVSDRHVYKYRCSQCSLAFKTIEKLQIHSQYHLIRAATQCVVCSRSFRSIESLQKHMESSHSNLNDEELEQYRNNLLQNHLLLTLGRNGGVLDPSTTELLKKESLRSDDIDDQSMDLDNGGGALDLASYQSKQEQDDHHFVNHAQLAIDNNNLGANSNTALLNGNTEQSSANSLEDYLNSQQIAEESYNDPSRKYKCHRCKMAFTKQSYLTAHNKILLHRKGEKMNYPLEKYLDPNRPFKCEICKESFTQKNILLVHYNSVSHLHRLKQSMKESSAAVAASVAASQSSISPNSSMTNHDDENNDTNNENKLFKCNLCKVSYSMPSSLHNHLRSTLHQTRTSKLHELAQSGQLDLSLPLIEPLNYFNSTTNNNNNNGSINNLKNSNLNTNQSTASAVKFAEIFGNDPQQQQALSLQQAALNLAISNGTNQSAQFMPINGQSSTSSPFTCSKCQAAFISKEAQLQHQHLCGLFGNLTNVNNNNNNYDQTTAALASNNINHQSNLTTQANKQLSKLSSLSGSLYKNKPQLYKHLLETWGFEIVMQFNESNQKILSAKDSTDPESQSSNQRPIENGDLSEQTSSSQPIADSNNETDGNISEEKNVQNSTDDVNEDDGVVDRKDAVKDDQEEKDDDDDDVTRPKSNTKENVENSEGLNKDGLDKRVNQGIENESTSKQEENSITPPELNKCQCDICFQEFSSIWVLKAHREEIHKDLVPLTVVESFADEFRNEYDRKFSSTSSNETDGNESTVMVNKNNEPSSLENQSINSSNLNFDANSNGHTAVNLSESNLHSITSVANNNHSSPCSSPNLTPNDALNLTGTGHLTDPISALNPLTDQQANGLAQLLPNLGANATPAEIAAANQMAAQIQFSQLLMSMGLAGMAAGMPMSGGMPFAAAAAMGIPPQLLPMMMADPMMAAAAAFNNPALAAAAAAQLNQAQAAVAAQQQQQQSTISQSNPRVASPTPVSNPTAILPVVNQSNLTTNPSSNAVAVAAASAAAAQQQKRARTRISDEQLKVLRQYFDINNSPTEEQLIEMSQKSGLPMKVIKHWFRNTLFKERQRNKDSPYNFNNPPSTYLNLDEYEKTGEAKVFTLDDLKKCDQNQHSLNSGNNLMMINNSQENLASKENKSSTKEKPNDSESEYEAKISNDLKSSSSNKDTDYATSDDEEIKRSSQPKDFLHNSDIVDSNQRLSKHQSCLPLSVTPVQDFDQLSKSMSFNMGSPQPSESSMSSSAFESTNNGSANTSSLFAGLANFSPGSLSSSQNMASSLQMALDAQRSQLAAAAVAANSSKMLSSASVANVSSHSSSGKRANRTRFTDYQIKVLQEFFESNAYPKDDDLEYLSKLLNLSPRVIVVWFQNARQKARKVYENQPPSTPVGEDDGSGRFQRTPGLNYQCKKCLQVFQRYYELIKHQKNSCFKDENPLASQIRLAAEARAQASSPTMSRDSSTPIDCTRSATTTPEKLSMNLLASPNSAASPLNNGQNGPKSSPNSTNTSIGSSATTTPTNQNETSQTFRCDKCPMVFNRIDLWRDHQIVHLVNSNLFNAAAANPFGLMQLEAAQQQQSQLLNISPQPSPTAMIGHGSKRKILHDDDNDEDESCDFDSMSGNGNSNSSDQTPRDKRLRTTILPEQLDYLYQKYQIDSNPSRKMLESIAKEVGLKKRVVQVWFQNTRARERKGQFRAHQQVIHKRCPFCRALFKARSALESHLATRHADQYTKGDINIDNLPDGDPSEDGELAINETSNVDSSQMADVMKRYEDSFKKYLDELNIQDIANIFVHLQEKMAVNCPQSSPPR
ncbi:Zinc finger protein 2 [Sarcoptes scabiei]|uniref:Zinc finger protein 2 n=1 Tax=Sarcoptes scabiei TaxID=52283 RepID=A0A834R8N1_SARSC|nr:Zinc finger protein 2 [Sarcoptes scabiei]